MTTRTSAPYTYRYYPNTRSYVAVSGDDGLLYYLGPATGNRITSLGSAATWSSNASSSSNNTDGTSGATVSDYYDASFCEDRSAARYVNCSYTYEECASKPDTYDFDLGRTYAFKVAACYGAVLDYERTNSNGSISISFSGGTNCYSAIHSFYADESGSPIAITRPHWAGTASSCGVK
jgi:hypothetical protein